MTMNTLPSGFFDGLNPGWFLQWGAERASAAYTGHNVAVISEAGQALCGIVFPDTKQTIHLVADSAKCGLL